jgi:hypothetical protein
MDEFFQDILQHWDEDCEGCIDAWMFPMLILVKSCTLFTADGNYDMWNALCKSCNKRENVFQ